MPHSVPVSKLMTKPGEWPQIRSKTLIKDAIRILRILTEERKIERGHIPLVFDDDYNLLGLVRLTDLLRSVRHLCESDDKACDLGRAINPVEELVIPFPDKVRPDDSILVAIDIMTNHGVQIVPVMDDGKLKGLVKLSDIFDEVAALLFDVDEPSGTDWISDYLHI
jgi:CBS domain-containing protein